MRSTGPPCCDSRCWSAPLTLRLTPATGSRVPRRNTQTRRTRYVDAGVWLPKAKRPEPDEALRVTIERDLGAYGPASIADVGRWLGQPRPAPIREAIDALGDRIRRMRGHNDRELIDLADAPLATGDEDAPVRFLARWDSVILGYEVRDRILPAALAPTVIKKNADILATLTVDGLVAGTWSVATNAGTTTLEVTPAARGGKGGEIGPYR